MAARHAQSQVHPSVADSQAIFTAVGAGGNFSDLIKMCALVSHLIDLAKYQALPHGRATDTVLWCKLVICE